MNREELVEHLHTMHGIDADVARDVIGGIDGLSGNNADSYLRGFHDGQHGEVDADDLDADDLDTPGHSHD